MMPEIKDLEQAFYQIRSNQHLLLMMSGPQIFGKSFGQISDQGFAEKKTIKLLIYLCTIREI